MPSKKSGKIYLLNAHPSLYIKHFEREKCQTSFWTVKNTNITYVSLIFSRALPITLQIPTSISIINVFPVFYLLTFIPSISCLSSFPSISVPSPLPFCSCPWFCILLSSSTLHSLLPCKSFCPSFSHLYLFPGCNFFFFPFLSVLFSIFCLTEQTWYSSNNLPEKRFTSFKSIVSTKGMESVSKRAKWLFQSLPRTNKCSCYWQLEKFSTWVK